MMRRRAPFAIVFAALAVSAPRLAVAFLLADGVAIPAGVEVLVYVVTGIASGVVLTGGNVYLAHAIAEHWKRRGGLWAILLVAWGGFLVFAVVLIAPALVYGLTHSVLAEVLTTSQARWAWSVVAALSVEILAAAAMAAYVLSAEPTQPARRPEAGALSGALTGAALRVLNRVGADATPQAHAAALPPPAAGAAQPLATPPPAGAPVARLRATPPHPAPLPLAPYRCTQPGCDRTFGTQQALAAHTGAHRRSQRPAAQAAPASDRS